MGNMKKIKIALITLLVVLAITTAVFLLDPFNWHLRDRLSGDYDAALTAIPADSLAYISINFLQYDADEWESMGNGEMMESIDEGVFDETGLHFADEIQLWVGQYAGAAILSLTTNLDEE